MINADMRCAYWELESRLRPFVARRVSADSEVDDVLQDVFLRLQRSLSDLRDEQRFGPWVYQLARSAIAAHGRNRARHPVAKGAPPDVAEAEPEEDDGAVAREVSTYLAPFIALLPSPYREALTRASPSGAISHAVRLVEHLATTVRTGTYCVNAATPARRASARRS
jgi:RNA polymerase sigma-70 factor (ECF subfamily)